MKVIKKILAGLFLTLGLSTLPICIIGVNDSHSTKTDREGALVIALVFSLPSTAIGTWLIWSLRQQHQQKLQQLNLEKEQLFLHLLQQTAGEITVTSFALSAQIPIADAQLYLDQKAKQLTANLKVDDEGIIIYKFPPL